MGGEILQLLVLTVLCAHIGLVWTLDAYDEFYDEGYADYVDNVVSCKGLYRFCPTNGSCLHISEPCDGKCGAPDFVEDDIFGDYDYLSYHYCSSTDKCINKSIPCDGKCPDDYPNLCDNGTLCYPNSWINNRQYDCKDKSDEYRPRGEPCGGFYRFCHSNGSCLHDSEPCVGQCGKEYHFCPSNGLCLHTSESCDGQCVGVHRLCPSTDKCIDKSTPCDGNCPVDLPNLCDNGTLCYPNSWINNRDYDCKDRSDEFRLIGEPCGGFYRFCPSNGSCLHDSESCDGQCGKNYHYRPSTDNCIYYCKYYEYYCPSTDSCIDKFTPCDGNCPDDYPNLCDNGTLCYTNYQINDRYYSCKDKSDEYRPTGKPCGGFYRFCSSNGSCLHDLEACDGQCKRDYHFCPSTDSCLHDSKACDGKCGENFNFRPSGDNCIYCKYYEYYCPSTDSCNHRWTACDGKCPDDLPNLCDNGTLCYPNSYINNRHYDCKDKSDEYRPTGEPCGGFYRFCPSNGSCLHDSKACDDQCGGNYHFCPTSDSCIDKSAPCDGKCPDDYPNLCDNGTVCHPNSWINNRIYGCKDKSDEYRPTGEPCGGFYRFCPSNGSCFHDSEHCDGQCGDPYFARNDDLFDYSYHSFRYCSSTDKCIDELEDCDGQCVENYHFNASSGNCMKCAAGTRFCPHNDSCLHDSELCDGQCRDPYTVDNKFEYSYHSFRYCSSTDKCIDQSEDCDGQCVENFHFNASSGKCIKCETGTRFCPSANSCIAKSFACDGNCSDDFPNLCDNGTICYANSSINDRKYDCKDESDEYRPTAEPCGGFYRFCPSNESCLHDSEACDGQCGRDYHFCPFTGSCFRDSVIQFDGSCEEDYVYCLFIGSCFHVSCIGDREPCDAKCGKEDHFCAWTGSCVNGSESCDGNDKDYEEYFYDI